MSLKYRIAKLEDVAENLRSLYTQDRDGGEGFVLDADMKGSKLDEFRENNRKLHSDLQKATETALKYKDIDPEEYRRGQELLNSIKIEEEKALIKAGKFDEVIARRTALAISEKDGALKTLQGTLKQREDELSSVRNNLAALQVDTEIRRSLEKTGVKPRSGALDDILRRARDGWKINDKGQMTAVDHEGKPRYGGDGEPLTMEEFVKKDLVTSASHLFEGAAGGGAAGGEKGAGPGGPRRIDASNPMEFGKNLADIASGKVVATLPESK